jgi:hypothetical protein
LFTDEVDLGVEFGVDLRRFVVEKGLELVFGVEG